MAIRIVESTGEMIERLYDTEVVLHKKVILKTCQKIMDTMKNELPEEAHSIEVLDYILNECKDILHKNIMVKL